MLYYIKQPNRFPAAVTRIGSIEPRGSPDGIIDSDVATQLRGGVIETDGLESIASPVISNPHESGKHWIPYQIGGQTRQGDSAVRRDSPGDIRRVSQRESGSIL